MTKQKVLGIVQKYGTRDPQVIAEAMGIIVIFPLLDSDTMMGLCARILNRKVIVCNGFLESTARTLVLAHELGHALQHGGVNAFILRDETLFPPGKIENQANRFAAELLIPDSLFAEYAGCTAEEIAYAEDLHPKLFEYKILDPFNTDF